MRPSRSASLVLVLLAVVTGCGGDDGEDAGASPTPEVAFGEGPFEGLPVPPLAEEAGTRSEEDGVITQSFLVRNRTPEGVLGFYEAYFEEQDVPVVSAPRLVSGVTWRGWWLIEDRELLVSALPAPAAGGEETAPADVVTQMSLELWPPGSADEHAPPLTAAPADPPS